MSIHDRAARKLAAGEWLSTGEAAALLRVDKTTVIRMAKADPPEIVSEIKPGIGRYRLINPADVRRLLDESRRVHGGEGEQP